MSEKELIAAFEAEHPVLYRFARRLVGSTELAQDLVQDTFLFLCAHPERFRPERASIRVFLLGVLRNRIREHWRKYPPTEEISEQDSPSISFDPLLEERSAAIALAVATLPPLQREVLVLAEYEELSNEEIASIVGADLAAVKSRLHRARTNLRSWLAPLYQKSHSRKDSR